MSASEELAQLYAQWRVLTEQEGQAIGRSAWLEVNQCQASKARLQPRIDEISKKLDPVALESAFRPVVDDLIQLERRNSDLLRQRRTLAQGEMDECNRSCRSLRQIQRSYLPRARQNWQSYS